MSHLADKRYIYLAGRIELDHMATQYRAVVAPIFRQHGLYTLDPLRGKYHMESWDELRSNEVITRDLQDIERCHVMLAIMLKHPNPSFGTPCEIMHAWERRKPVILVTDDPHLVDHYWVNTLCANIFFVSPANAFVEILGQAVEHICQWYGESIEHEIYTNPKLMCKK